MKPIIRSAKVEMIQKLLPVVSSDRNLMFSNTDQLIVEGTDLINIDRIGAVYPDKPLKLKPLNQFPTFLEQLPLTDLSIWYMIIFPTALKNVL